jgi:hypothetical protein
MVPNIVDVSITLATASVTKKSFGVVLIVGSTKAAAVPFIRTAVFTSAKAVLDKGYASTSPEYLAAAAVFSQAPRPQKIIIGQSQTADADVASTMDAILLSNPGFYFVVPTTRTKADVKAYADWVAADGGRILITASDEAALKTDKADDTTSLWYLTQTNERCKIIYHTLAQTTDPLFYSSKFSDAAYAARAAVQVIGDYTMKFKRLDNVLPDNLSTTDKDILFLKRVDTYTEVAGAAITENGTANTEWLDVIVFRDWVKARMEERIFSTFLNNPKIPYTDAGVAVLAADVEAVLKEGLRVGGIAPFAYDETKAQKGGYVITTLPVTEVSADDKGSRSYNFIEWTAWLAGAIHDTLIRGTLTY